MVMTCGHRLSATAVILVDILTRQTANPSCKFAAVMQKSVAQKRVGDI